MMMKWSVVLFAAVLFVQTVSLNAATAWDVSPTGLHVINAEAKLDLSPVSIKKSMQTTFDEHQLVRINCVYHYLAASGTDIPPWQVEISVDGEVIGTVAAQGPTIVISKKSSQSFSFEPTDPGWKSQSSSSSKLQKKDYLASVEWKAIGDGARTVQCRLNPAQAVGETNPHNNITQQAVTVKRLKPLTAGDLPPVVLTAIPKAPVLFLGPGLQLPLHGKISAKPVGGKPTIIDYVKVSAWQEDWHIEIVKAGGGALGGFETKVGELSGPVQHLQFNATLTAAWLAQHQAGPGKYAARAYISQQHGATRITGPSSRIEFTLTAPLQANQSSGNVAAPLPALNTKPPIIRSPPPKPSPTSPQTTVPGSVKQDNKSEGQELKRAPTR